ncbi:MAG: universal stress protein [Burkholderiaceae bacterium]|nr:universal stress protein [Burkholderiaceae bacterium]
MYQRILVPIDGSPTSDRGLQEAIALGKLTGASLRLLHVVDETSFAMSADAFGGYAGNVIDLLREGGAEILAKARSTVEAAGLGVDTVLRDNLAGRVSDLVTDEAKTWPADLIVLGTHGRRGAGRLLLGSDAEQVLRQAPVPVLLLRSAEAAAA